MTVQTQKPGRPLGVSLAVLLSIVWYSMLPLLVIAWVLLVERRVSQIGGETGAAFSGGNFRGGITNADLILQCVVALAFLVVAVLTWRGRPKSIRWVMMAAVLLMGGYTALVRFVSLLSNRSNLEGGSLDAVFNAAANSYVLIGLLIPLYVIWYLNRAPARAFYRGYYLTRPAEPKSESVSADVSPSAGS